MRKPGANKFDQRTIKRMGLEGHSIDAIARITGVKPRVVKNFLPTQEEVDARTAPTTRTAPILPTPAEVEASQPGAKQGPVPNLTSEETGITQEESSD